jgi:hypothetical protein
MDSVAAADDDDGTPFTSFSENKMAVHCAALPQAKP